MRPERAGKIIAQIGVLFLAVLLFLRIISLADSLTSGSANINPIESQPYLADYVIMEDGAHAEFRQGLVRPDETRPTEKESAWYLTSLSSGMMLGSEKPENNILPFVFRNRQLIVLVGSGTTMTTGSPEDYVVYSYALAPSREFIVFTASLPNSPVGLFVLRSDGDLLWLGEEENILDLSWSLDSEHLAFLAPREGVYQVFRIDRSGTNLEQLTSDPVYKKNPVWLADDRLAFLAEQPGDSQQPVATPVPSDQDQDGPSEEPVLLKSDLYLVGATTSQPSLLLAGLPKTARIYQAENGTAIAFTAPISGWPYANALFVVDPSSGEQRQAFPVLTVKDLVCPDQTTGQGDLAIKITLENTSEIAQSLPLIVRVGPEPLSILAKDRTRYAQRVESIDLAPGQQRELNWSVRPAPGLVTHISALANMGDFYPLSEKHCAVPNKYMGLPSLTFLRFTFLLIIPGMLLLLPFLLQQKKKWLWILWLVYPLIILTMIFVEVNIVS
jgi:hypothetical protein